MDKAALEQAVYRELTRAELWDSEHWQPARVEGVALYEATMPAAPSDTDLSGAVSADVGDMVEAIIAQMQPAFTGTPAIEFTPSSQEDENAAASETWFTHRELARNGQDFIAVTSGLRDALLARTCIFKVWIDERKTVETRIYSDIPPETAAQLLAPANETESRELEGDFGELERDEETGNIKNMRVEITTTRQALRVAAVAPEDFRKWADWQQPTLAGCPFQAERLTLVRGELLGLGVDEVRARQVPALAIQGDPTKAARDSDVSGTAASADPMLEPVEAWRVYIAAEFEEGGEGELYTALWSRWQTQAGKGPSGFFLTEPEQVPFGPYCCGCVLLQSHRFLGKSAADKLKQTQLSKSEVLRQWLDNLAYLNNGRIVSVQGQSNPAQLEKNNKPGGILEAKQPNAVQYIIGPDAGPSALSALSYLDKARAEAGGASLDLQTAGGDKSETWRGTERQYSAKEMLAALMLRTFAETGLRELYLLAHRTLRAFCLGSLFGKPRGEWVSAEPGKWPERDLAEVCVGAAGSAQSARVGALMSTLQEQLAAMQAGKEGELVTLDQIYQVELALGRARGIENITRLWVDPGSAAAKAAGQQKAANAAAQASAQAKFMERIAALQVALTAWEKRLDASVKYFQAVLDAEVEQMKVLGHSTTELEKLQLQGLAAAVGRAPANPAESEALQLAGAGGGNGASAPADLTPPAGAGGMMPGAAPGNGSAASANGG